MDKGSSIEEQLVNLIRANTRIIQIVSYESQRVYGTLVGVSRDLERKLFRWNVVDGIMVWDDDKKEFAPHYTDSISIESAISFFVDLDEPAIMLMEDIHTFLHSENRTIIQNFRSLYIKRPGNKTLIFSQPIHQLPVELEKDVHVMIFPHPSKADLKSIFTRVCDTYNINFKPADELIDAALGLTIMQAEKAFSLAYVEAGKLTESEVPIVIREKEQVIKKSGYLEYYHPDESFADVGGLGRLKTWLEKRRRGFDIGASDFGLTYPRGILLLGIPGTGKSLTAKAVGSQWNFPLLRLDMGKIFGGIVGESEHNMSNALQIAESISPCVLWIDEIEKGLSGIASSGSTDGGTTARVLGTFLTWMQEKKKPVFVLATANDISLLPPELLRKGRVDEIFFVDLPTKSERIHILEIHIRKIKREVESFDLERIAELSNGFSGAELAEAIQEALYQAYDASEDITTEHIVQAIEHTYPLSRTMTDNINGMRKWCKAKAVMASDSEPEPLSSDKNTPKLRQETNISYFISER